MKFQFNNKSFLSKFITISGLLVSTSLVGCEINPIAEKQSQSSQESQQVISNDNQQSQQSTLNQESQQVSNNQSELAYNNNQRSTSNPEAQLAYDNDRQSQQVTTINPPPQVASNFNQRGDMEFVLINNTGRTVERFYASPTNVDNWENDILADDVLYDRGRTTININDDRQECYYDFLAVVGPSEDGTVGRGELYQTNINICDIQVYEYWDNSGVAMK